MELLRFFTAGNVDDGKSTLIGRLLYDSGSISTDIIETLTKYAESGASASINLAQLTDGLRAEREQGITIDVAYKYFTTTKRKFIIADTPGHFEYTRNMFTGASNADAALILIDAKNGITDQTRRHTLIASILNISEIVVCINKMDLVDFSENVFKTIKSNYLLMCDALHLKNLTFIPISALCGDNIVQESNNMPWYKGCTLFHFLENVSVSDKKNNEPARFRTQYIIQSENYRGIAGNVLSGYFKRGQRVVLSSGMETIITKIETSHGEIEQAFKKTPVVLHLKDNILIERGDVLFPIDDAPQISSKFKATICWMDHRAFNSEDRFILQQDSSQTHALITLISKVNIDTFAYEKDVTSMGLNDIFSVNVNTECPVTFDSYRTNRFYGAFILIDKITNHTVAAGVIQ